MTKYFFGLFFILVFFISCKKENDNFTSDSVTDYYSLQVGKYITYNLDSSLYINFGLKDTTVSYQVQDRVDAQVTDNLGRDGYRIIRYIRKDATEAWEPNNTFMVVPTDNSIEYIENNLRFLKLKMPVKQDYSWKGNSYIDTYTLNSDLIYLDDWDYIYDSINVPLTINSLTFDSTLKVFERDEFEGDDPSLPTTQYADKTYSVEKYAKGVGLIYREFLHWEYQGEQSPTHGYTGYGVKLSIIDHN